MNFITNVDLVRAMERQKWKFFCNLSEDPLITVMYIVNIQFQPVVMITALA